jgi:hypothetical protein
VARYVLSEVVRQPATVGSLDLNVNAELEANRLGLLVDDLELARFLQVADDYRIVWEVVALTAIVLFT